MPHASKEKANFSIPTALTWGRQKATCARQPKYLLLTSDVLFSYCSSPSHFTPVTVIYT